MVQYEVIRSLIMLWKSFLLFLFPLPFFLNGLNIFLLIIMFTTILALSYNTAKKTSIILIFL